MGICSQGLTKKFGGKIVLDGLSFVAREGAVTLLAGRNGAGKTTWIRLALGLTHPTEGSVTFGSRALQDVRQNVSVVIDEPPVYPHLTGSENLRQISGVRHPDPAVALELNVALGLTPEFLRMRAGAYSLGQRRRLAIAAALIRRPSFLFLDEPTIGLDPMAWEMVRAKLAQMRAEGATVVLTGQDFGELENIFDHIVVLQDGSAAFDGSAEQFLGRRPPRVVIETCEVAAVESRFPNAHRVDRNGRTVFEIPCTDDAEARSVVTEIMGLGIQLRSVNIVSDSLEQAFTSLVGTKRSDASDRSS